MPKLYTGSPEANLVSCRMNMRPDFYGLNN